MREFNRFCEENAKERSGVEPKMRIRLSVLVLVAATLLSAGCGGGSSKALTQAELIGKADTICVRLKTQLSGPALNAEIGNVSSVARIASRRAAIERAALAELGKLTPPTSLASDWQQVIADRRILADDLVKLGEYAKANNVKSLDALYLSSAKVGVRMIAMAKRDGFKQCSRVV
jgi:predicted nucleic acid-binding protein